MAIDFHGSWLLTNDLAAVDLARADHRTGAATGSELATIISAALRRGLTAKFFAVLGAEGQLRADLQEVCREARRQNMRVEYLIIAFKDAWRDLPEARTLPRGSQGTEFLNRVITLCIAEFYAPLRAD
jgi:hypothetical protein